MKKTKADLLFIQIKELKDPEIILAVLEEYGLGTTKNVVASCFDPEIIAKIFDCCPEEWEKRLFNSIPRVLRFHVLTYVDDKGIILKYMSGMELNAYVKAAEPEFVDEIDWYLDVA